LVSLIPHGCDSVNIYKGNPESDLNMKTIVWDVDDALNDLMKTWFEFSWLPSHPECRLRYENLSENPPDKLLNIERVEYLDSLDRFRLSSQAANMSPDVNVVNWFEKYGTRFRHIALTARPRRTVSPLVEWMMRHFGNWFQTFSFVPSERPGEPPGHPDRNKRDVLSWLAKVDYYIDDSPENVKAAEQLGITAFAVARPWNRSKTMMGEILETIRSENALE
jgi:hypothetical protein